MRTRFAITWWIIPNNILDMEFLDFLGLDNPLLYYNQEFQNLLPLNYFCWSYMISVFHVLLNKLSIDIARLLLYCVSVIDFWVKVFSFTCYNNIVILRFYIIYFIYTEFLCGIYWASLAVNLPYLYFTFFTLVSITNINFLLDRISNVVPVQMFTNHCFHSIHSFKKDIFIILI